jgi:hypothetical protein
MYMHIMLVGPVSRSDTVGHKIKYRPQQIDMYWQINQLGKFRITQQYRSKQLNRHYRLFLWRGTQYTLFSLGHRSFSRIDHILGHETRFNK